MPEDVLLGPAIADPRDHRSVVERIRYNDHAGDGSRQCRKSCFVCDKAGGEDQRGLALMQVSDLGFEFQMEVSVAGDVARAAAAGTMRLDCCDHRLQHSRMLTHAEIIVGAPYCDFAADTV